MKVTYLGTGAAEGIPALFCNCEYCREVRKRGGKEIRSRAQMLYDELSVDFPPDAFYHAAHLGADLSAIRYLLVTHAHMDHFNAHEFVLRGYKYARDLTESRIDIYANEEVCEIFDECTRREMRDDIAENIGLHPVGAFEELTFGDWRVHTLAARHTSSEPLLFLLDKKGTRALHLYDTGILPEDDYEYLRRVGGPPVKLVTLDCTFLFEPQSPDARHLGVEAGMAALRRLEEIGLIDGKTKRVITHFSHNSTPSPALLRRAEREYGLIAAYDGMELTI